MVILFIIVRLLISTCYSYDLLDQESISVDESYLEKRTDKIISRMSLEQKIGQMMVYGFKGTKASEDALRLIDKYNVGGLVVFTHNIEDQSQLSSMTRQLQNYSVAKNKVPVFIAIDQEGGKVMRIKNFGTTLPGNMNIGATRSSELSFLAGKLTAVDLEMLGINVNFAPVIDVNTSKDNEVIGVRSFGSDPDMVAKLGSSYIRGIQSRRVSATAKHFPGHGDTSGDSHFEMPSLNKSYDQILATDLKPFRSAIRSGVDSIMTAHISVPSLDPSGKPATLSKKIINGLLREQMKYQGLVVTDDMEMQAITKDGGISKAAINAVLAGCDIITVVWTDRAKDEAYTSLLKAVKTGLISEERIDQSVKRIIKTKLKRGLFEETPDPKIEDVRKIVGNKLHQQIAQLISERSITVVKNFKNIIPLSNSERIVVVSPFAYLADELNSMGLKNDLVKMRLKLKSSEVVNIVNKAVSKDKNTSAYLVAVLDQSQTEVANMIKKKTSKPVIVASLDSPYMYSDVISADAYLCAYSFRLQALKALAEVLVGKFEPVGKLPVEVF
jgi:beta-N-acetylhexosaminidase